MNYSYNQWNNGCPSDGMCLFVCFYVFVCLFGCLFVCLFGWLFVCSPVVVEHEQSRVVWSNRWIHLNDIAWPVGQLLSLISMILKRSRTAFTAAIVSSKYWSFPLRAFCSQFLLFILPKCTQYAKYIYLSPVTSYMFRCLLHHIQVDHYVICSRTVSILQRCDTATCGW